MPKQSHALRTDVHTVHTAPGGRLYKHPIFLHMKFCAVTEQRGFNGGPATLGRGAHAYTFEAVFTAVLGEAPKPVNP